MTRAAKRSPEIGDLYHRPRRFSRSDMAWRRRLVRRVRGERHLFPGVDPAASAEEIRARIDDGVSFLREVSRCLAILYGTPDLGNKTDPVDELVYIILARKTRERAYPTAWGKLKSSFPTWDELLASPVDGVRKLVESSGLGAKKTVTLIAALSRLRDEFGSCTLEPAREARHVSLCTPRDPAEERLLRHDVRDGPSGLSGRHSCRPGAGTPRTLA